jgi:hypothetical protein
MFYEYFTDKNMTTITEPSNSRTGQSPYSSFRNAAESNRGTESPYDTCDYGQ